MDDKAYVNLTYQGSLEFPHFIADLLGFILLLLWNKKIRKVVRNVQKILPVSTNQILSSKFYKLLVRPLKCKPTSYLSRITIINENPLSAHSFTIKFCHLKWLGRIKMLSISQAVPLAFAHLIPKMVPRSRPVSFRDAFFMVFNFINYELVGWIISALDSERRFHYEI